ncbi:MAG: ABC transporter permease subunit [Variibacter sp.]
MASADQFFVQDRGSSAIGRTLTRIRRDYFKSPLDALISIICLAALAFFIAAVVRWAILDSVWNAKDGAQCAERGAGACWAVIRARAQLIVFGLYPYTEIWRAGLGCLILLVTFVLSCIPAFWRLERLVPLWVFSFAIFLALMYGGILSLPSVAEVYWGGIALTFLVFAAMVLAGMPFAFLLALARHSGPPWLSRSAAVFIDAVRSLPLVTILFAFWLAVPLIFPAWMHISTLSRALIGFIVFFACYEAEVLRGGLQAIGRGQVEAAQSLGMRFWQYQVAVISPQVFRISLPQTMNLIVGSFKDTSYIAVLGFFDMVAAANAAVGTGDWNGQYVEVYLVVALFYLLFGTSLSRYGAYLERKMSVENRR